MSQFNFPYAFLGKDDPDFQEKAQDNLQALLEFVNSLARFIDFGTGAPTHTPDGVAAYFRFDGGAGTTFYVYEPGTGWTGK